MPRPTKKTKETTNPTKDKGKRPEELPGQESAEEVSQDVLPAEVPLMQEEAVLTTTLQEDSENEDSDPQDIHPDSTNFVHRSDELTRRKRGDYFEDVEDLGPRSPKSSKRVQRHYSIPFYDSESESDEEESYVEDIRSKKKCPPFRDPQDLGPLLSQMSKTSLKIKLPQLATTKVSDYKRWKEDFENTLFVKDLEGLLDLPNLSQATKISKKNRDFNLRSWEKASRKLYALVYTCMPEAYKKTLHTYSRNDGAKALQTLEEHVCSKSKYRRNYLQERLANARMREDQPPSDFISYLNDLMDELEATGDTYTTQQRV